MPNVAVKFYTAVRNLSKHGLWDHLHVDHEMPLGDDEYKHNSRSAVERWHKMLHPISPSGAVPDHEHRA